MKQTFLCAAVLAVLAGAAPFLCLALPSPSRAVTAAAPASPETAAASAAATADPGPTATQTPDPALTDASLDLLLYDEAAGTVVTVSPVEYMVGAAASEMPLTWPDDALIAQMVASHTYALYSRDHGGSDADGWLQVNSALASGWTDEAALRARWGEDYEENHARLTALAEQAADSLVLYEDAPALTALGLTLEGDPAEWVDSSQWDKAGYVQSIQLGGMSFSGTAVRSALDLRSACFAIAWRGGQFVITTRGYGHGVGLSQYGAKAMAEGGAGWRQILEYYFPGCTVS